jgi:hypothetical protein
MFEKDHDAALVHRSFGVTVRAVDGESRSVDVIASTDAVDAYGEIVDQSWDLKRYLANPVVLYNHNREGILEALDPECTLPIGYAKNVGVVDGKLQATLCFVDEKANPMGEMVLQGFLQKSLRAVSVGFHPRTVQTEKLNDKEIVRLSDNELFEISVTPMGANPEAVAKSRVKSMEQLRARASASKSSAHVDKTENPMTEEEILALREKSAKAESALVALEARFADVERVSREASTLAERSIADALAVLSAVEGESLVDAAKRVSSEVALAAVALKAANEKIIDQEVTNLVGVKITAHEKSAMVKLALLDRPLFDETLAARPDMKLLGGPIVPAAKDIAPTPNGTDNGAAMAALLSKSA